MDSCERFNVDNGMFIVEHIPVIVGVRGTYQCDSRYILNGTAERVCTILNEWSGQPAKCILPPGMQSPSLTASSVVWFVHYFHVPIVDAVQFISDYPKRYPFSLEKVFTPPINLTPCFMYFVKTQQFVLSLREQPMLQSQKRS